jgi:hypothetical protein
VSVTSRARPPARLLPALSVVLCAAALLANAALAQETVPPPAPIQEAAPPPPPIPVRLLKNFVLDGGVQPNVWLEMQWRMETNTPLPGGIDGTRNTLSGILALGFNDRVEAGLQWGGMTVDPDGGSSNSGASDLEVYGKYLFGLAPLDVSVGGLVKIPTASSEEMLGSGSVDWEGFAAVRKDFGNIQAVGNLGLRWNGDPDVAGVGGETSLLAGGGVIFGLGKRSSGSLELNYESRRYEGLSSDFRMTPGFLLRIAERGFFRAGVGIGLSDGAPDMEFIAGLGWSY